MFLQLKSNTKTQNNKKLDGSQSLEKQAEKIHDSAGIVKIVQSSKNMKKDKR